MILLHERSTPVAQARPYCMMAKPPKKVTDPITPQTCNTLGEVRATFGTVNIKGGGEIVPVSANMEDRDET